MSRRYWLLKSDPDTFGLAELQRCAEQTTCWDGVRNYQARNLLRDEVQAGDGVLFYHSQAEPPAVVALARVVRAGYPDPTQFDPRSQYHDPAADRAAPRWYAVDIRLERPLARPVTLAELRGEPALRKMGLLRKGNRLSVQPVSPAEWKVVLGLGSGLSPARLTGARGARK